jgi:hypothetical protein
MPERIRTPAASARKAPQAYLMQVILFVDLLLQLPIYGQPQQVRILLAGRQGRVELGLAQDILKVLHGPPGNIHLLVDRVFEVPRQVLDLLDLLLEIAAQAR